MVLVSTKYKFIYIKLYRVAGTTTEIFFQKYCLPPNHVDINSEKIAYTNTKYGIIGPRGYGNINKIYTSHTSLSKLSKDININNYLVFCNIRNPYDMVVSYYNFMISRIKLRYGIANVITFDDYIALFYNNNFNNITDNLHILQNITTKFNKTQIYSMIITFNYNKLRIQPRISITNIQKKIYFIRFENLEYDIIQICKRLHIPINNLELFHYKKTNYNSTSYHKYYNIKTQNIIANVFKTDLDTFNYNY